MDYEKKYNETLAKMREWKKKYVDSNILSADGTIIKNLYDIFPELKESEDERIRKALAEGVRQIRCKDGITQEQMLAWLEKQKEQKPSTPEDIAAAYQMGLAKGRNEQKSAEWSEEDEKYLNLAINIVASDFGEDSPTVSFLKSLRPQPHWKPSEEQMNSLMRAITWLVEKGNHTDSSILADLRHELQKLM